MMKPDQLFGGVILTALMLISAPAFSQFQIPNGGFENWTASPSGTYEEPSGAWWTSLNALKSLGAPVSVSKDADAHSGNFSAKLRSVTWGTLLIPGLLVSGEFDVQNPNFLIQGQPCTDLPTSFQGWYKYSPVNGDSAGIAALLTRWNGSTSKRDTLAQAAVVVYAEQTSWTAFNLPFDYALAGTPDTILVALVSSQDGQNFNGEAGSTLWIDDISLDYTASSAAHPSALDENIALVSEANHLKINLPSNSKQSRLQLYDLSGRVHLQADVHPGETTLELDLSDGIYLARLTRNGKADFCKKIILRKP